MKRISVPIKESSDELNPSVGVSPSSVPTTKTSWKASDYLALAIATCGVGYLPLMPGTFGSMVGVGIFLLLTRVTSGIWVVLVSIPVITFAGIWAATRTEQLSGRKDPGKVVVDEVAGQMISLLPLMIFNVNALTVMISFTLFRVFDIVKPYPARRLEALRGGYGIMCDDLVAGVYGAVITSIIIAVI
jgi:phosphatidylglycerophosphatase A